MAAADPVRLVRPSERSRDATPTPGMTREQAIASQRMWAGFVRASARADSAWHHHAAYETAIFVVSGRIRMESGLFGTVVHEAGAGDFLHVPAGAIHRETNPEDGEAILVVVRAGAGTTTVNVDGPAR